ncbi:MAG: hypothetical protein PHX20_07380 [Candidatus Omnitrophica bacterium]|nr:hypothetical protein [Candidatus Omnitrophota bacterium]MDD5437348.1 hypothetical protein [Candidatus Omnitrophota bacterium]
MGKVLSLIIGTAVAVIGVVLLVIWWSDFAIVLKGSVPVMLIFGGVIAVIAGLSELKDEMAAKENK